MIAQVVQPAEGLSSSMFMPLYLAAILYVALFVAGRVLDGREDDRAESVQDAAFALMLLTGVYVLVLLITALFSEFDLIADAVQIMAIMIGFFAILVVVLLGIELLVGLRGRRRERVQAEPPPGDG